MEISEHEHVERFDRDNESLIDGNGDREVVLDKLRREGWPVGSGHLSQALLFPNGRLIPTDKRHAPLYLKYYPNSSMEDLTGLQLKFIDDGGVALEQFNVIGVGYLDSPHLRIVARYGMSEAQRSGKPFENFFINISGHESVSVPVQELIENDFDIKSSVQTRIG